jgi:hypothetical protein
MKRALLKPLILLFALAVISVAGATGGCGAKGGGSGFGDDGTSGSSGGTNSSSGSSGDDGSTTGGSSGTSSSGIITLGGSSSGGPAPTCTNGQTGWQCKVDTSCKTPTTLTGKVFDPAGANPLYNVVVFIPDDPTTLPAITPGTHTCNTCDVSIGNYVVAGQTAVDGSFSISPVPTGTQVPVTVQVGKWRRTTYVNITNDCGTNAVQDGVLHLPGKRADGDMPQIALLTGGCDDMGCFLTGMGVDPSEFEAPPATLSATAPHNGGRVDVYTGTTLAQTAAAGLSNGTAGNCYSGGGCPLWASQSSFEYYDMALFSCECGENNQTKPSASMGYLRDWLDEGGKVFASHYQYTWFKNNPSADLQGVATWLTSGASDPVQTPEDVNTTFFKGNIYGEWLKNVGALTSAGPPPSIDMAPVATSVSSVNSKAPQATTQWIYDPSTQDTKYMSFGTPIGGAPPSGDAGESGPQYCGKAVFTDLHAGGNLLSTVMEVPGGCNSNAGKLSGQEKALEFLFFDLSACVTNDMIKPPPPPAPPPQ